MTPSRALICSWQHYCKWKGIKPKVEPVVAQDYHTDGSGKSPRYYQLNAVNRTTEAIATGQDRILLVMATGTGKTYTAFQIIWRLWKAGAKKRILFLADRNILVDQTPHERLQALWRGDDQDRPNGRSTSPTRCTSRSIRPSRAARKRRNIFKQFSPEFFRSDCRRRVPPG